MFRSPGSGNDAGSAVRSFREKILNPRPTDETVVHVNTVYEHSGSEDFHIVLAGVWVVAGLLLMGVGIALHGHSGTLLTWMG
uniref:Uncharacterized protein n=1 Tax=Leptospirillum sp. Group II '5-way CG' TaxID=419541 RepID=B6AS91_9BACT|nr:MAG: Hypothetical protein CGL2_07140001 [Leptospirillum sp. Group II '5-way CG']